jgi:hypothetical protein
MLSGITAFLQTACTRFIMFNLGNMRKTKYPVVGHKELVEKRMGLQNHQISSSHKMLVV